FAVGGGERRMVGVDPAVDDADQDALAAGAGVVARLAGPDAGRGDEVVTDVRGEFAFDVAIHRGDAGQARELLGFVVVDLDGQTVDHVLVGVGHVDRPVQGLVDGGPGVGLPLLEVIAVRLAGRCVDVQALRTGHLRAGGREPVDTAGVTGQ